MNSHLQFSKTLTKTLVFAALTFFTLQSSTFADDFDDATADPFNDDYMGESVSTIEELMDRYHKYDQFNGAVLVVKDGDVVFKRGYGWANREWKIENTPDTKFRIASVTKQFTAMLVMQLVQAGKIRLDAPISTYLPDYRKDTGKQVTIHHLLSHTSGIPNYTRLSNYRSKISLQHHNVDEFSQTYCSGELEFTTGSKYSYSNSGYYLLSNIIEKVTGQSFAQALTSQITEPLGMKDTGFEQPQAIMAKRASGYQQIFSGYANSSPIDMSTVMGAGSMVSTVEDLVLWDEALYGTDLLTQKHKDRMFRENMDGYGYGWGIKTLTVGNRQVKTVRHLGGINGFASSITRMVDDKHMVVLLNNTDNADLGGINANIINILYDQPYTMPKRLP
ncbi:MAG: CubicO group peptidase (beta-lactamase class C family) [Phenylobacterium sp.]|jgi:CubicO group peptidase (beta-lactamase class C family)